MRTHTCLTETWSLISSCTRLIQWPQQWLHQHLQKTTESTWAYLLSLSLLFSVSSFSLSCFNLSILSHLNKYLVSPHLFCLIWSPFLSSSLISLPHVISSPLVSSLLLVSFVLFSLLTLVHLFLSHFLSYQLISSVIFLFSFLCLS